MSNNMDEIFTAARSTGTDNAPNTAAPKRSKRSAQPITWETLIEVKESTKRLNLDIPESADKALATKAKRLKITKSALVRRLIDAYLENVE